MLETLLAWLLTYLLHSTLLLGAAWGAERAGWLRGPRVAEIVWRAALFGGLLTASLQGPAQHALDAWSSAPRTTPMPTATATHLTLPQLALRATPTLPAPPAPQKASQDDDRSQQGWPHIGLSALAASLRQPDEALAANRLLVPVAQAAPVIVIPWLLLAALALGGTARAVLRLQREAAACPPVDDAHALHFVRTLRRRAPRLRLSTHWSSPLVTPFGEICLPAWVFSDLDLQQREAVLAHEVAHLRRHDPLWRLAGHTAAWIGWLQPLNRLALRRLDAAAELMCDGWAASQADRRHELAEALYLCAQRLAPGRTPALAMAMARGPSPLLTRIESLMKERPTSIPKRARAALTAALMLVVGGFLALPVIGISKNTTHVVVRNGELGLDLRIDGDVTFNDDESDVRQLTDHALFQQTVQGHTRSIEFQPGPNDAVARLYKVDGQAHAFDAEAKAWLAQLIPQVLRSTAWHAQERLARIRARSGVAAAIDEVARAPSSFGRTAYVQAMAATGALDAASAARLIAIVKTIDGDFERSQAYQAILQHQHLAAAQLTALLQDLNAMHEGFEKQQVLSLAAQQIAPWLASSRELTQAYVQALQHLQPSFERSNALIALVNTRQLDRNGYAAVLEATEGMDADFDTCNVLKAVAAVMPNDAELVHQYRRTARRLSEFERGQAERALDRLDS
jgi:beta-lactamase regulating signal transducer with metallopeptidase domain